MLVDGGPDATRLLVALDRRLPPWDRRLDAVVLSHPHEDHVAGLARLLERYRVAPRVRARDARARARLCSVAGATRSPRRSPTLRSGRGRSPHRGRDRDDGPVAAARQGADRTARRRDGDQQRLDRAARNDRSVSLPPGGRRGGGHRSEPVADGTSASRPVEGRSSRQPDRDDAGVRGNGPTAHRDRLGRRREHVRTSDASDARSPPSGGRGRLPDRPGWLRERDVHIGRHRRPRGGRVCFGSPAGTAGCGGRSALHDGSGADRGGVGRGCGRLSLCGARCFARRSPATPSREPARPTDRPRGHRQRWPAGIGLGRRVPSTR